MSEDDIPTLTEVVRPGDGRRTDASEPGTTSGPTLSSAEIEAIAARVVERETARIEQAVARAITEALEARAGQRQTGSDSE